jgi:hypothetical protein
MNQEKMNLDHGESGNWKLESREGDYYKKRMR